MSDRILVRKDGPIGHVIFNNPQRHNAVSLEMWDAVGTALDDFTGDEDVRALIFSGAGGKAFVAGADISKFESERASEEAVRHYDSTTARIYRKIQAFPRPTIAQIDGFCIGGGVALAVCCDLRLCGEGSQFAIPAAKLGLGYGLPGVQRLVDLVGPGFAKEIFFSARRFTAAEAYAMGLVNRVVPDARVAEAASELAGTIAENAPLTIQSIKTVIGELAKDPEERDLARCEDSVRRCFASRDYVEGRRAFLEKRKPVFIGA